MSAPADSSTSPGGRGPGLRTALAALGLVLVAAVLAFGALTVVGVIGGSDEVDPTEIAKVAKEPADDGNGDDPFAYRSGEDEEFEERGAEGYSHVLYEKSPGGIIESAKRTARYRDQIEVAAEAHGVDPDFMEAMVLLESAGRPDVIAGDDPEAASGIAQIVASTGISLLGMDIDLAASKRLTKQIAASQAEAAKQSKRAEKAKNAKQRNRAAAAARRADKRVPTLIRQRAEVDARFDPEAALDGMGNYLQISGERFGREDLGVASYHMGIGNLEVAIGRYLNVDTVKGDTSEIVADEDFSYPELFFGSSPLEREKTWSFLDSLGDDSSTYLWRVLAAEEIMRLYRDDPDELDRLNELHSAKATSEEVFHPADDTEIFADPDALQKALDDGDLETIPDGSDYGYEVGPQLGELAEELGVDRSLYRSLRPEALAALIYMSSKVQAIAGEKGKLIVTSAARDETYQDALVGVNGEATDAYSLHTTGYSFDILRKYRNGKQARAFQFALDRLKALAVIDYAVEPQAIHVTVSNEAKELLK